MDKHDILNRWIIGPIDKVGSYIHLDLRYYVSNLSYITITQVISGCLALLLSVAFARLVSKELYGQWNFILSIIGTLAILSLPGIDTAIAQAVARGRDRVLIEGIKERFKWSILGCIALLGAGIYYYMTGSAMLGKGLMIASLFFPFFQSLQAFSAFLSGKKRFIKNANYLLIIEAISVSATVVIIYFTRNLIFILITYLVAYSLMRGIFFLLTARTMGSGHGEKEALAFGKKMSGLDLMGVITTYGDKIILGIMLGFSDLAIYSIARGFEGIIRGLMKPIASFSMPKLATMDESKAYAVVKKRYFYLMLATAIIVAIPIALCPFLIPFFYSEEYAESVTYAQILVAILIFGIPNSIFIKALLPAQKKVRQVYQIEVARVIIHTALFIGLTTVLGLMGLVLAKVITGFLIMIYTWWQAGWIRPGHSPSTD